jgi:hypothetical protein
MIWALSSRVIGVDQLRDDCDNNGIRFSTSIHAYDVSFRRTASDLARFLSSLDETGSHLGKQDFGMVNPGEETLRMSVEDCGADFPRM